MPSYPGAVVALAVCEVAAGTLAERRYIVSIDGQPQTLPFYDRSMSAVIERASACYPGRDIVVREVA